MNEIVALHARFTLAMAPMPSAAAQSEACKRGSARFDEFVSQVERRVQSGTSLLQETLDRLSARGSKGDFGVGASDVSASFAKPSMPDEASSHPAAAPEGGTESALQDGTISRDKRLGQILDAIESRSFRQRSGRTIDQTGTSISRAPAFTLFAFLAKNRSLLLRVFLPFVAAYYLSFLFRTINATMSETLTSEFGLSAGDLGLLTSVYFLTFAIAQIPIGILLDRYGPRRIQSTLLLAVAVGAALFAVADNFPLLLAGRAVIGLGVAAALTAGLKALVIWFPKERVPLLNGVMIMLGALGAVTATLPADALLAAVGWRMIFELSAVLAACCAAVIYFVVPEASVASVVSGPTALGLRTIYSDCRFWRLAPLSAGCIGTAWALQGLWAAPWLADVEALDRPTVMRHLFIMAIALSLAALLMGLAADRLRRRGVDPKVALGVVGAVFILVQMALIVRLPLPSYFAWAVVASYRANASPLP
ncbi:MULTISPECIES: MFS transporter [Bradyrhizobium]|uniref:Nitrate/nitrite transporter NarK n=2 Tax=Bradyrhizobium TaxID=374 RepID=A0ABY0P8E5_9BRAD|nr:MULTISPECIES: MFS transporter [Bradyrhizobium]SDH59450.1 Nitrate/nitrite transporter NarK [Bradyrhizobium ottawaense]SEE21494.1 Nitrate/nitrite transporter NarK [Bradyrhizobium lablabi]SHM17689.1 Nitrate/nitrite transporter NarK [Bradyrhizobium lablabi]